MKKKKGERYGNDHPGFGDRVQFLVALPAYERGAIYEEGIQPISRVAKGQWGTYHIKMIGHWAGHCLIAFGAFDVAAKPDQFKVVSK